MRSSDGTHEGVSAGLSLLCSAANIGFPNLTTNGSHRVQIFKSHRYIHSLSHYIWSLFITGSMDVKTDFSDHRIHGGVLRADRASPTAGRLLTANRLAVATAMSQAGLFLRGQPYNRIQNKSLSGSGAIAPSILSGIEHRRNKGMTKPHSGVRSGIAKSVIWTSVAFLMGVSLLFVVYPNGAQTLVPRTIPCAVPRFALDIMRAHSSPPARVTPWWRWRFLWASFFCLQCGRSLLYVYFVLNSSTNCV